MQLFSFKFDEKPSLIIVEAWPSNENSDPDIYMQIGEHASDSNYQWKANNYGAVKIIVDPERDKRF